MPQSYILMYVGAISKYEMKGESRRWKINIFHIRFF